MASSGRSAYAHLRRGDAASVSTLEEAIVRRSSTLVEDPDSAELLNLLPDIVGSARAAADTIAPGSWSDRDRWKDGRVDTTRGWTDGDRRVFKDSLLEVLENAEKFHTRVSPPAPT